MLMFFYQITTLLSIVALEKTLNTHGLHAKGAFLHRLRPLPTRLPIKRKGNCKSIKKKHLMMGKKWAKLRLYPTGFSVVEPPLVHYIDP